MDSAKTLLKISFFRNKIDCGDAGRLCPKVQVSEEFFMDTTAKNLHTLRGEWMLALAVCINSFGVVLMLYSGAGISAISSVPFAFSEVLRILAAFSAQARTLFNVSRFRSK